MVNRTWFKFYNRGAGIAHSSSSKRGPVTVIPCDNVKTGTPGRGSHPAVFATWLDMLLHIIDRGSGAEARSLLRPSLKFCKYRFRACLPVVNPCFDLTSVAEKLSASSV